MITSLEQANNVARHNGLCLWHAAYAIVSSETGTYRVIPSSGTIRSGESIVARYRMVAGNWITID